MRATLLFLYAIVFCISSCKKGSEENNQNNNSGNNNGPSLNNTLGFSILAKSKGIWNGPVTSTTALGSYPEWIVDFRPVSENQISAKNELDSLNDIFMSFFVVLHNNQYKIAFRNGGSFGGMKRVSYLLADSVSETGVKSYYRFSEVVIGKKRAYSEVIFSNDSMYLNSYTNIYNTQSNPTPHMSWKAKLQDTSSCQNAVTNFSFPKKTMCKDFTNTFNGLAESIFYQGNGDPYPESAQPYLGKTTVNVSYDASHTAVSGKKVLLVITTQPLFSGFTYLPGNLKYRSRYVILDALDQSYTFNYMHPGSYYLYAFYDSNGNGNFAESGDWFSYPGGTFNLSALGNQTANVQINFTIP